MHGAVQRVTLKYITKESKDESTSEVLLETSSDLHKLGEALKNLEQYERINNLSMSHEERLECINERDDIEGKLKVKKEILSKLLDNFMGKGKKRV